MTESEPKNRDRKGISALFIPAGLFLGLGTGWAFDNLVPGIFVGLSVGVVVFALILIAIRD